MTGWEHSEVPWSSAVALAIPRRPHLDRALLGRKRLRRRTVASVASPARRLLMTLLFGNAYTERRAPFHQPSRRLGQWLGLPGQQPAGAPMGQVRMPVLTRKLENSTSTWWWVKRSVLVHASRTTAAGKSNGALFV